MLGCGGWAHLPSCTLSGLNMWPGLRPLHLPLLLNSVVSTRRSAMVWAWAPSCLHNRCSSHPRRWRPLRRRLSSGASAAVRLSIAVSRVARNQKPSPAASGGGLLLSLGWHQGLRCHLRRCQRSTWAGSVGRPRQADPCPHNRGCQDRGPLRVPTRCAPTAICGMGTAGTGRASLAGGPCCRWSALGGLGGAEARRHAMHWMALALTAAQQGINLFSGPLKLPRSVLLSSACW
mmetsp:Transcript_76330/g.210700  ORF Transcript_76330/g.210700 Transcript_76330/m.210700 type:complete len:233 (+) Transcript_76330:763-1461(+)